LGELGILDEAVATARRAIELDPNFSYSHGTLGSSLRNLGRLDESIRELRTAVELTPDECVHRDVLIYTLLFHPASLPEQIFAEHVRWAQLFTDPLTAAASPHTNDRNTDRRLRVGYVSAHYFNHAVNFFSEPLLAAHDHDTIELFCYDNGSQQDDANRRLRSCADHWREIGHLTDGQAAQTVRQDQIDILIDLSGHIAGHRLLLFARKPAPVQVTYLGYQATTGMQAMDYRLSDEWSDPPGTTDACYTEKLVRLAPAFFCYRPSPDAPPVGPLPALENGYTTFGSFNNFAKVTPAVLATWAQLLRQVPQSCLVLLAHAVPSLLAYVKQQFANHGVEAERVTVLNRCARGDYLQRISQVDIALDPFPFNGHTTTCDALWQGVPVVTLAGNSYAARFGSSAHVNLELKELVAASAEQYVAIAAGLAGDLERLQTVRADLRTRMAASPLLDGPGFARRVETAYRGMWIDWCQNNAQQQIST
jgi:predicted O-linked N-acetylglucosamine transferase (SPINDLY family)